VKPPTHQIDSKWIEFALLSTAIFGLLVQAYWGYRKSARVWLTLFLILVLHIAVFSLILIRYDAHWPLLVQVILFTVEGMILTAVMYWILAAIPYSRPR
jgi:hypothetical protein